MVDIPLPEIVRQVSLQWKLDSAAATAAVDRALSGLGIVPRKKLFGGRTVTSEEYRMLLDWLNQHGLR